MRAIVGIVKGRIHEIVAVSTVYKNGDHLIFVDEKFVEK